MFVDFFFLFILFIHSCLSLSSIVINIVLFRPENFVPVLKLVQITLLFHLEPNFGSFWPISACFSEFRPVDIFSPILNLLINAENFFPFQVLMAITWIEPPIAVHLTFGPLQVEWLMYSSPYSNFPTRWQLLEWTQAMAEAATAIAAASSSSSSPFFILSARPFQFYLNFPCLVLCFLFVLWTQHVTGCWKWQKDLTKALFLWAHT